MDITDILSLLSAEKAGDNNAYDMASTVQIDCHNYRLQGVSTCNTDIANLTLYIQVDAFEPIEYVSTEKGFESGNNEEIITWKRIEPVVKFIVYGNEALANKFHQLSLHETITFTNLVDAVTANIKSVSVTTSPIEDFLRIEVSLSLIDSAIIRTLCCGSYYANAPFNECDGTGETGDPSDDPACVNYVVNITSAIGPPFELTAASTGGGGGTETFTWYKDGALFGTGATIQPTLPGVYRVDAVKGNCLATQSYTYSGNCGGFAVTIQDLGDGLLLASPNLISTIQWQELIAAVWTNIAGATSTTYQVTADGEFRAVATSGTCTANSTSLIIDLPVDCTALFTLTLVNSAGDLELTINGYAGVGTPSYQWFLDSGAGLVLLASETSDLILNAAPGFYQAIVTLDGCSQAVGLLVQCNYTQDADCAPDDSEWSQTFAGDGTTLAFNVTNFLLPDPAFVDAVEITATLLVTLNGARINYVNPPVGGTDYGIDYPNQEIEFAAGWAPQSGDVIVVTKLRWVKL